MLSAAKTYYTAESDDSDVVYYVPANVTSYDTNKTYYVASSSYYTAGSDSDSDGTVKVYYTPVNSTGYDMNQTYYVAKTYYTPESDDSDVVYYVPTNSTYDMNQTYYVARSYYSEDSDSDATETVSAQSVSTEKVSAQSVRVHMQSADSARGFGVPGAPLPPISHDPADYYTAPPQPPPLSPFGMSSSSTHTQVCARVPWHTASAPAIDSIRELRERLTADRWLHAP